MRIIKVILFLCSVSVLSVYSAPNSDKKTLSIAISSANPEQIAVYSKWLQYFEQANKDISVNIDFYSDANYKRNLKTWLEAGTYDVLTWQAGKRLNDLVDLQLITPVQSILRNQAFSDIYSTKILRQVSRNGFVQALPFAQYAWGVYYNKAIFEKFGLSPPNNWREFIAVCEKLKRFGISPLIQATHEDWPTLAWLDYMLLAPGTEEIRNKIINGDQVSESELRSLRERFGLIISGDYFFAANHPWSWQESIYAVARQQAAMTLTGQFAESIINKTATEQLGFFPFPNEDKPFSEVAPMDVFFIPTSSTRHDVAAMFLEYLLEPAVRTNLALDLGWLPADLALLDKNTLSERVRSAAIRLESAEILVQYFDREAEENLSLRYATLIENAMITNDTSSLMNALAGRLVEPKKLLPSLDSSQEDLIHLATLKGLKSTFLVSFIMQKAYAQLGKNITVTRYSTTEEAVQSLQFENDGELARISEFGLKNDALVKVPEPIISASIYLASSKEQCSDVNSLTNAGVKIGTAADALLINNWLSQQQLETQKFADQHLLWKALEDGELTHLITFEADLFEHRALVQDEGCYQKLTSLPFFHFLNKEHAGLASELSKAIAEFKKSDEYKNVLKEYGVGVL